MAGWGYIRFRMNIGAVWSYYKNLEKQFTWLQPLDIDVAWSIYDRARRPSLGFHVMGRTVIDKLNTASDGTKSPMAASQYGNAIDVVEHHNFGLISSLDNEKDYTGFGFSPGNVGSILNFYQGNKNQWHFAYNDSWILGGLHGQVEFQMISPRNKDNLWEGSPGFMTVTGRELVGLTSFGYSIQKTGLNDILYCTDRPTASAADFQKYHARLDAMNSRAAMYRLVG